MSMTEEDVKSALQDVELQSYKTQKVVLYLELVLWLRGEGKDGERALEIINSLTTPSIQLLLKVLQEKQGEGLSLWDHLDLV